MGQAPQQTSFQFSPIRRKSERNIMKNLFNRFVREEDGQDLIEYVLLAALIAVAAMTAMTALVGGVNGVFGKVTTAVSGAAS